MRYGIREICDVVLRAKSYQTLGNRKFYKNEPVLYFDSLKTSSLEGAATTVYAQGGRGNARLVAWEGERTLTFTMEDALLSMESFSILSGAGLMDAGPAAEKKAIYVHHTSQETVDDTNKIKLPAEACWNKLDSGDKHYHSAADIFVMVLKDGEVNAEPCIPIGIVYNGDGTSTITCYSHDGVLPTGSVVLVDYYVQRESGAQMIEITADKFGGNYYLEASTLFRRESDGVDMPAEFIIPNCKVQSNFTFSLAATGDPSTFTFTMDAFPDYTKFDPSHKVLCAIQVITDESGETQSSREPCYEDISVYESPNGEEIKAEFVSNTPTEATIKVTGKVTGVAFDTSLFGTDINAGAQIDINLPVEANKKYNIITTNPAYKHYPSLSGSMQKEQVVLGSELITDGMKLILTNDNPGTNITLKMEEVNNEASNFKKYTIVNEIDFRGAPAPTSRMSTFSSDE